MSNEINENDDTTNSMTEVTSIETMINRFNTILVRLDRLSEEVEKLHQSQKTIMVGWNAFLKSAEAQLKALFKGNIPTPMLKKLLQMAFRGMEDAERKGQ
jgi:K+/H+ antiporter YhaU regulatory subunit KhtT